MFSIKIIKDSNSHVRLAASHSIDYWAEEPNVIITKSNKEKFKIVGVRYRINLRDKTGYLVKGYEVSNSTIYIMQDGKTVETLKAKEHEELITEEENK